MSCLGSAKIIAKILRASLLAVLVFQMSLGTAFFGFAPMFSVAVAEAATGVPQILAYQGRLTDSSGDLLGSVAGTNYYFKFSIWDGATTGSGTKLWPSSAPTAVTASVISGVFSLDIGDTDNGYPDALDYDFQANKNVYLQVEVSSDNVTFETLSPRQRVTSAGFAINAGTLLGFTPSQTPTGSNIPVLESGNLLLAGTNPQINATSTNALVLQGGTGTGDIQFFSSANKITSAGNLTIAGVLDSVGLTFVNATGTGSLTVADLVVTASTTFGGVAYTWPGADGSATQVLTTDGSGALAWSSVATGISGSGATNYLTKFIASSTLANSALYETGGGVGIGTISPSSTFHVVGTMTVTGVSSLGAFTFTNATGTGNLQVATLNTTGAATISGALNVTGVSGLAGMTFTNATGTGNLQVGSLVVTGQTNLGSASTTNLSVSGSLELPAGSIGDSELASTGVTAGSYGSGSVVLSLTLDEDGRVTAVSTSTIGSLSTANFATTSISQWNNDAGYIVATLTQEQVEDYAGAMTTGNTETGITVTYQDGDGTIDFEVGGLTTSEFATTSISQWNNDSGYVTDSGVTNINGQTGASQTFATTTATSTFTLASTGNIHTLTLPSNVGFFTNDSGYLSAAITSINGETGPAIIIAAGTGITVATSTDTVTITNALGSTINPGEMADADFGDWTCLTGSCTIDANAVALGTDTTGNYIATVAGSSQVSVSGSGSETAAVTLGIVDGSIGDSQLAFHTGQALTTTSTPTFNGLNLTSLIISGDTINDFNGTGLTVTSDILNVSGLTVSEFATTSISQWNNDAGYISATLTEEEVQDFAWNISGGTQTGITVTYQDSTNDVDFVIGGLTTAQFATTSISQWNNDSGYLTTLTGALLASNNLSDLISTSTARTNLGLGSAALQNTGTFLQTANNLSDLSSTSTARTNIGFTAGNKISISATGTIGLSTSSISQWNNDFGYITSLSGALLASNNLSDLISTSTARSNLGVDIAGTDNSTDVTLAGEDYLSLSGQQITANAINPDNLSASDFGDFTCNGTTCTLDTSYLTSAITSLNGQTGASQTFATTTATSTFTLASTGNIHTLTLPSNVGFFSNDAGYLTTNDGNDPFKWIANGTDLYASSSYAKVGIGTTAPSTTLHVVGTLKATGAVTFTDGLNVTGTSGLAGVTFSNATGTGNLQSATLTVTGSTVKVNGVTYNWPSGQGGASTILTNDGSGGLTWGAGGGGGGTATNWNLLTNPTSSMSLSMGSYQSTFTWGATTGSSDLFNIKDTAGNSGAGVLLNVLTEVGSSASPFRVTASGTTALAVEAGTGRVGIGTTAPSSTLHIIGTLNVTATTTLNGVAYSWPGADGSISQVLTTDSNGQLSWATAGGGAVSTSSLVTANYFPYWTGDGALSGTSTLYTSSTRIGIGTTAPSSTLHVVGTGRFSDNLTLDSGLIISGDTINDFNGTGLTVDANVLNVSGLTVTEFATTSISQWNNDSGYITATLTEEEVQDFAWNISGGTQTGITVIYQDGTNDVDFVIGGLTTAQFATTSISQWNNDSGYISTA
ncbi:MAG: hypothetical protein COU10_03425, partial [Candidatus Harrisonbacteria bacterium CG10_big_fil_rev_8_21_14_0_10_45_28]